MSQKRPCWSRSRAGRNRVHWVAYDDRPGSDACRVVDQGYATNLPEADAAARSALASEGMYQARRLSTAARPQDAREKMQRPARPSLDRRERPREYLYTRLLGESDDLFTAAHLILRKTAKRIYVTRKSCGPDQIGTADEVWDENEPKVSLDRNKLERDGSVYSSGHRLSDFYQAREAAQGGSESLSGAAFRTLGVRPPATLDDIKAAYRRSALEAHPDRGGKPAEFQAVEVAYRRLVREARGSGD